MDSNAQILFNTLIEGQVSYLKSCGFVDATNKNIFYHYTYSYNFKSRLERKKIKYAHEPEIVRFIDYIISLINEEKFEDYYKRLYIDSELTSLIAEKNTRYNYYSNFFFGRKRRRKLSLKIEEKIMELLETFKK